MSLGTPLGHTEEIKSPSSASRTFRTLQRVGLVSALTVSGVWIALGGCNSGKPPQMSSSLVKKVESNPELPLNIEEIADGEDVLPALRSGVECQLGEWCLRIVQCGDEYHLQIRQNGHPAKQFTLDRRTQLLLAKVLAGKIPCTMNKTNGVHFLGEGEAPQRAQVALHCKVDNLFANFANLSDFTICGGDLQVLMRQLLVSDEREIPHDLPVFYPDKRMGTKGLSFKKVD
jgi:hypothetical protein